MLCSSTDCHNLAMPCNCVDYDVLFPIYATLRDRREISSGSHSGGQSKIPRSENLELL